jgi:hypothetical protein
VHSFRTKRGVWYAQSPETASIRCAARLCRRRAQAREMHPRPAATRSTPAHGRRRLGARGLVPLALAGCALLAGCTERQPPSSPRPPVTTAGAAVGSPAATTLPQRSGYAWCDDPGADCPESGQVPTSLRRPLRIPPKPAGGRCPRTTTTRRARWGELLLGPGPVYAGSVSPGGPQRLIVLQARGQPVAGWRGFKTRWVIHPSYPGPVLIRGRALGGPTPVGFGLDPRPWPELQLWPRGPKEATDYPRDFLGLATRVPRPGCYAWQIDGEHFTEVIVFQAVR